MGMTAATGKLLFNAGVMRNDLIDDIIKAENLFPRTFADMEEREWGVLFVTPTIRDSYDGNHACILNNDYDPVMAVGEIVEYYESRGLAPRLNYISSNGDHPGLMKALVNARFKIGYENTMRMYLYEGPSRIKPNPGITVRRIENVDGHMLAVLASVENMRMAKVIQRRVSRADDWLFVGEVDGRIVSVALLERIGNICRVDEVHTNESHRRQGCSRAVIHAMITFYLDNIPVPLYLWTDNPIAERIYTEAGFVRLDFPFTNWSAWREM